MNCIRCGCEDVRYSRRDGICDPCRKNMAELEAAEEKARALIQSKLDRLRRFEERESVHIRPLLSAMSALLKFPASPESPSAADMLKRIKQARDFVLQPSNPALDPVSKTGGEP